jgi:hypothetical protein
MTKESITLEAEIAALKAAAASPQETARSPPESGGGFL